jgi:hypothetical protein
VRNQPYEPPARFDLDQNTCFSEGGIVRLRGAGPPSVRRKIRFVVALVMVTGGGLWLLFQLFIADYVFGRLIHSGLPHRRNPGILAMGPLHQCYAQSGG